MTRPSTGTNWNAGGFNDRDPRFLERGKLIGAGIRDAHGLATDISPHNPDGTVKFSPYAVDGELRGDLFGIRLVNGIWLRNPDPNEGLHLIGAFKEGDAPKKSAKIDTDDYMIEQDIFPFDTAITKQVESFSFTGVESAKPLLRRLREDLPLSRPDGTSLVELPGEVDAGWSSPLGTDQVGRQVFLFRSRPTSAGPIYTTTGYSLAKRDNIGDSAGGKKDADAAELSFTAQPDGIFMAMVDGEYVPIIKHTWVGGPGWLALGNGPSFGSDTPLATATTAGAATVRFDNPSGGVPPYSYTVEAKVGSGSWGAATVSGSPAVSGGKTTLTLSGLSAGSTTFRVTVTDANGAAKVSSVSNAVTVTS